MIIESLREFFKICKLCCLCVKTNEKAFKSKDTKKYRFKMFSFVCTYTHTGKRIYSLVMKMFRVFIKLYFLFSRTVYVWMGGKIKKSY